MQLTLQEVYSKDSLRAIIIKSDDNVSQNYIYRNYFVHVG